MSADPTSETPDEGTQRERGGSVDAQRYDREKQRVQSGTAWTNWKSKKPISKSEADAVFRIDSYATEDLRVTKIDRLRKMFIDDKELSEFVEVVAPLTRPVESNGD